MIIFSISNLIVVIINTYETLFGSYDLNLLDLLNLRVLLIPIWIQIGIIYIFSCFYKIKKTQLMLRLINIKVFLWVVVPFLVSAFIVFLVNIYKKQIIYMNYSLIEINKYIIFLLLAFVLATILIIYIFINIIRNRALFISKIGSRLIIIIGIAFIASMLFLNTISKFVESYALDYGNILHKTHVETKIRMD